MSIIRSVVAILALAGLSMSAQAQPTQLLHIHNASLTDYVASPTEIQGFQPTALQRAVNVDGTQRRPIPFGLMLAANPSDPGAMSSQVAGVEAATGEVYIYDTHIALPGNGVTWTVGITLNQMQGTDSDGYQGTNWFQISQPELVFVGDLNNPDPDDMVYIVFGSSYVEFSRYDSEDVFRGVNGVAGAVEFEAGASGEPDLYTLYDARGTKAVFFGFNGDAAPAEGQLWYIEDPAGAKAYVGHPTDAGDAIAAGYDADGRMTYAYDGSDRRYTYLYNTFDSVKRLISVTAEVKSSGTWASPSGVSTVAKVEYNYYESTDPAEELDHGNPGSLQEVHITTPLSDAQIVVVKHYRYWIDQSSAVDDALKYVVDAEGARRLDPGSDPELGEEAYLSLADDANFRKHVAQAFEYDTDRRVVSTWQNGECGCSGPANGTHAIAYATNGSWSASAGYTSGWKHRTTVERPDGAHELIYTDELGQVVSRVICNDDPSSATGFWVTGVERDSAGRVTEVRTPAAASSFTYSTNSTSWNTSAGLIRVFGRESSGDLAGFIRSSGWKIGTSGTTYLVSSQGYEYTHSSINYGPEDLAVGAYTVLRPFVRWNWTYADSAVTTAKAWNDATTTTASRTLTEYTFHAGGAALMPEQITTTLPPVSTGNNGSNTSNVVSEIRDAAGRRVWQKTASGKINYWKYVDGRLNKQVQDANTASALFTGVTIPSGFAGDGASAFHRVTTYTGSDSPGGTSQDADENTSETYVTALADRRIVRLGIPRKTSGPTTYYGPVSYSVTNHAGQTEFSGSIVFSGGSTALAPSVWIDELDDDPFTALDEGTLFAVSTNIYNETGGTLLESRSYHTLTGTPAYDSTFYLYDDMGRRVGVKDPTATITRTTYDAIGRPLASYVGTNDNGVFAVNFESANTADMVKTSETTYDAGGLGGNSLVTKTTAFVQDSTTDQRETTYAYDARGRRIFTTNPQAPHSVVKLDNLGRTIAVGLYTSASGLSATTDPTSHTTSRTALSETFYDELGRTWRSRQHKITQSTGASADTLDADTWYDSEGRTVKHQGNQLTKSAYDRIGRTTHSYTLAVHNDSTYADALTVAGDIVVEQSQTVYESDVSDLVLMSVAVSRFHDDYGSGETTGALDTNTDNDTFEVSVADLEGRASITAYWYDTLDRLVTTAHYGNNAGSDFDRDGLSEPSTSDATRIVTTVDYDDRGLQFETTDPAGIVTRTLYDDAGRTIATIANDLNTATPITTAARDHDLYTRFTYENGLQSTIWVDIDGDGHVDSDDQVTRYIYGVKKGTGTHSAIAHNGLLRAVVYPDSTNTATTSLAVDTSDADIVSYAYNAQAQQTRMKDQAGNIIETEYDTASREIHRKITTFGGGFDDQVKRISTTYLARGLVEKVTQYDNSAPGSGAVVDEILYEYDDWGPVASITQDHDGAVSGGGTQYEVAYTYAKLAQTGARRGVTLSSMTMPDSTVVTYESLNNAFGQGGDGRLGRVTRVKVGSTVVAEYKYLGMDRVVRTDLPQPDYYSTLAGSSNYDRLDRFGRVTRDVWTADRSTDIDLIDFTIAYDERSNITSVADGVHASMGQVYVMDDLSRLTDADRGVVVSGSISTPDWNEQWTLGQTGTWLVHRLDLDGDTFYTGDDEINAINTFSLANAWYQRDIDIDSANGPDYTLAHDAVGNMIDDGREYEYVYDPFGRLRKVVERGTSPAVLVAEYRYNGLNQRITAHFDTDADGNIDGDDPVTHFAYDSRWRIVARYEDTNSDPTEQFIFHHAGLASVGSGSYIDAVILRDRDTNANGTLDERVYHLQNWRSDVVALISAAGAQIEQVRYEPYGTPFGLPAGDTNADGDVTSGDVSQVTTWYSTSAYDIRGDLDMDGIVSISDVAYVAGNEYLGHSTGRGKLSLVANRKGYAGHENLAELEASGTKWDVRNRVLMSEIGTWNRRGFASHPAKLGLFAYAKSLVSARVPMGKPRAQPVDDLFREPPARENPFFRRPYRPLPFPPELRHCFDNPQVLIAHHEAMSACGGRINVRCTERQVGGSTRCYCSGSLEDEGPTWPAINLTCDMPPPNDVCRFLLHELIHARQCCERNPGDCGAGGADRCILYELEAYMRDGACDHKDPGWAYNNCLCENACNSCTLTYWTELHKTCYSECMLMINRDHEAPIGPPSTLS